MILSVVIGLFVAAGVFFTLVAAVGLIRFPDVYSRAHAVTKVDTLGIGFLVLAVGLYFATPGELFRAVLLVLLLYFTSSTAAHAITRAAYSQDVEVWTAEDSSDGDSQ